MALTHAQMDQKIDEHFDFEARDDVEGVLATLTPDAEHDVGGSPLGPTQGRDGARPFYVGLFSNLSESRVETIHRLYGDDFVVDDHCGGAERQARPSDSKARIVRSSSGCCTLFSSPTTATSDAKTCGST